jgi:hypothetical protein
MKMNKKIIASIVIGSFIISAVSHAYNKPLLKQPTNNHIELLFFQQAKSGSIKMTSTGCYDLKLSDLNPNVVYFSNSPNKIAGNLTSEQFLTTIKHSEESEKINPNAVLNMKVGGFFRSRHVNMIGSLSHARLTNQSFSYTFCPFKGNNVIKQGKIRSVNLFVDPIHRWPP